MAAIGTRVFLSVALIVSCRMHPIAAFSIGSIESYLGLVASQNATNGTSPAPTNGTDDGSKKHVVFCDTGSQQSPIDIVESHCKTKDYPHVTFMDDILFTNDVIYENNCETVKITLADKKLMPKVQGGPFDNGVTYYIDNIHFHWGTKNTEGCEHTISGQHFPMEAHVVMYKSTEKSFDEALQNRNVAVMSFMFELQKTSNEALHPVIANVTEILQPHTTHKASGASLAFLKDYVGSGFFTYEGSLTTHDCAEGVLWIIFKKRIHLGHNQLLIFHDVIGDDGEELQNWRKTKPLNQREVWSTTY